MASPRAHSLLVFSSMALLMLPPALAQVGSSSIGKPLLNGAQPHQPVSNKRRAKKDPAELYLTAYRLCRESESLAQKLDFAAAIKKGQHAEKIFAAIVRDNPDWKSSLLTTRRKMLAEQLASYREKSRNAEIPTGRQPGKPIATELHNMELPSPKRGQGSGYSPETSNYRPIELPNYESTDKELYNALALAQEECRKMAVAYRELNNQFKSTQRELLSAQAEQRIYKERYEKLQEQISSERTAGNRVVDSLSRQLSDMEAKYRASEQARQEAEQRAAELEDKLASTQAELERVTKERDALRAENEQLRAIVELNNPEKTKILLDQNLTLAEQLKQAQARVKDLEAQMAGNTDEQDVLSQQLDAARQESDRLREEMSGLYDENMGYRKRVSELSTQLNNLEADLEEQANKPQMDPALIEENKLLREVIAKQRRSIAMQEEGRKLIIDTYKQIKNNDPETIRALQKLDDESSLELTAAERRVMDSVAATDSEGKQDKEGAQAVREGLELETLANLASKAFAKQRYTAAEQLYRTLYESQPEHVAGLVNLGTILLYRNKYEEAASFLSRATRLSPDLAVSYYLAGICYYRLDKMAEAQKMFSRTVELDPANAEAFFYLANIESINNDYGRALKHYAAAVKIKDSLGDAHYNMARLYAEQKRIPDAARAYDRAVHNGAEPDPEFENYLRQHPDNAKSPGADLVAEVKPEEEAAALRQEDPELKQLLLEQAKAHEEESGEAAAQAEADAGEEKAPATEEELLQAALARVMREQKAAPSPSPAGAGHELPKERFGTVSVRPKGASRSIKLRLKRPAPQRIRARGGDISELKKKK